MKLTALNTAIRNHQGSIKARMYPFSTDDGRVMTVGLVKSELLDGLKELFEKNDETNLKLENGYLVRES